MKLLAALAVLLTPEEREAVLGDLSEAGEPHRKALIAVIGLIVRRQAELWRDWRPWLALVGFVIPAGLALHLVARWDAGLVGVRALREDPWWLAMVLSRALATLACWSFLAGVALRALSARTLIVQGPALLIVIILAQSLDFMRQVAPIRSSPHYDSAVSAVFYQSLFPWIVQTLFVAGPAIWGTFKSLSNAVLFAVGVTVVEFLSQLVLRLLFDYRFPALLMDGVVYWPLVYFSLRFARQRMHRVPAS